MIAGLRLQQWEDDCVLLPDVKPAGVLKYCILAIEDSMRVVI